MRPKLSLIALLALLLSSTGCAFLDRENLILFNAFEENVVPDAQKRPGLHIATAPLTIPGGFCLLLLDALIVHPSRVVDDAWNDTVDACWDDLNWDEHYVTEASFLPVRCMGTPIVFLFDFLGRSIFAIPPYGQQDERRRKAAARQAKLTQKIADHIEKQEYREALTLIEKGSTSKISTHMALICAAHLKDAKAFHRWLTRAPDVSGASEEDLTVILGYVKEAPPSIRQQVARQLRRMRAQPGLNRVVAMLLTDTDPVVRWLALQALIKRQRIIPRDLLPRLRKDPSESVRALVRTLDR